MSRVFACCFTIAGILFGGTAISEETAFTFLATSDSHYEAVSKIERNERNRITIAKMNAIASESWPEKIGGGAISKPLGVIALGDLIDDGDRNEETSIEWDYFTRDFGLDGTDGVLKFPVFEGWGNHDGPPEKFIKQRVSVQAELKKRNQTRLEKKLISRVSENGLHYSWDWHGVHFVQTNLYPADRQNKAVRYSLPWHDPQGALEFLKQDLAESVGRSGRPVVIMSHCGFDTDWWVKEDWDNLYEAVKSYNVLAYFHGHTGTGVRKWKPDDAAIPLDVINTGQTEKGFFVVEISKERFRTAYRVKVDPAATENSEWEWRYLFEKKLTWTADGLVASDTAKPSVKPVPKGEETNPKTSASPKPSLPEEPRKKSEDHLSFAVIGDFGLDNLKPKTAAKTAEGAKNDEAKAKNDDDDDDHEQPAPKALPVPSVPYVSSKEQRNPAQAAVAKLVKSWNPAFVVTTGDNNYPKGEADSIDDNIGKYYGDFIGNYRGKFGMGSKENRFFPVLGNHDWDSPKTRCQAYLDYFSLPGNERYYEFKQGPLHFIMLDNDGREPDGVKVGSKQYEWCKEVLSKSTSPFQIVVAHHPPFSSGSHGGITSANWDFDDMGVDLMLCGHDHNYERLEYDGLTYIVNGAGGANLRAFKKIDPGSKVRYYEKHGAMRIDVSRQNHDWVLESRFVNIEGKEIDRFDVRRPANGVVTPSAD